MARRAPVNAQAAFRPGGRGQRGETRPAASREAVPHVTQHRQSLYGRNVAEHCQSRYGRTRAKTESKLGLVRLRIPRRPAKIAAAPGPCCGACQVLADSPTRLCGWRQAAWAGGTARRTTPAD